MSTSTASMITVEDFDAFKIQVLELLRSRPLDPSHTAFETPSKSKDTLQPAEVLDKKSDSLLYYEQEKERKRKWESITSNDFTEELTKPGRFRSIFEAGLPAWFAIM
jgi:hypothetical protein